jgi:APA family basic amino acid/polyamine antiporter
MQLILAQAEESEHRLKRSMGVISLTAFGVAAIIGAGIFVLTGVAAATYAGPGITLSYVIAGIVSALAAVCYAELASTVPIAGSAYTYAYAVLGEVVAWIIGWDLVLEYGVGAGAVSVGWSGYCTDFFKSTFDLTLPTAITASPFSHPAGILNLPAAVILLVLTALLIRGTSQSSAVNNVIVAMKVAIVVFFIVVGATHIHPANWHPFLPYGLSGVTTGASIIFFAYIGFDEVSTAAEEARDPQRTMPRGIIYSLLLCTVLYLAVAVVLTGMVPYKQLDNASPVAHAMIQVGLNWAGTIISIGALAGLTTVLLVLIFGQSRILFSMSRDGLLPRTFSAVHPLFRTPYRSTLIVGVLVALLGAFTPINVLAELTSVGTLAAFALVSLAVWRLRYTQPDLQRGFRVPWVPLIPILSALAALFLIVRLPGITIIRFVVWLSLGLIVYVAYGRHHSELARHEGEVAQNDRSAPQ